MPARADVIERIRYTYWKETNLANDLFSFLHVISIIPCRRILSKTCRHALFVPSLQFN